ncbi:zeta toxin family protein [Streptomyces sp. NPDC057757]|uniref:zeta toxin family protein n=1 Tax=Streptomyces sp. NPDC057757 TaxID=3346241 RepID=UPI0036C7A11C
MTKNVVAADFAQWACRTACDCSPLLLPLQHLHQIFDDRIVPLYLGGIPCHQERPVALYIMGQPGAGKTTITERIVQAQAVNEAVRICADDLKQFHPFHDALMWHNSRTAGLRLRKDLKVWKRQIMRFAVHHRAHVVIEISPDRPEEFLRSAVALSRQGYQIKLITLAVRAADSFQSVACRYATTRTPDMPARFTTRNGHHTCFRATEGALRQAENAGSVDRIMLVDRQGKPLWSSRRQNRLSASQLLVEQRNRPYEAAEAVDFLRTQEWLWDQLPAHRDEVKEIDRLAAPLLPHILKPII